MSKKIKADVVEKSKPENTGLIESKYLYISPLRLALMNIFTLNLYSSYWFYKNWKYVKDRDGLDISPFWRCIFSPLFCHSLFKQIRNDAEMNKIKKATFNDVALAIGWVVLMVTVNALLYLNKIVEPWPNAAIVRLCIDFSLFLFLLPVQGYINQVNESLDPKPTFCRWSLGHTLFLIFGLLAFLGILIQVGQGK